MNSTASFQLYIFSGSGTKKVSSEIYDQSYALWKSVWKETLRSLDGTEEIASDNFTRQDEILSLFKGDVCIALVCHRYVDMSLKASREDSYFNPWPLNAIELLCNQGGHIAVGSQITIHKDHRRSNGQTGVKNLITNLSLKQLQLKDLDAITGTMRADKGMNKLFYLSGAQPLAVNVIFHNVPVDLVAFYPKILPIKIDPEYSKSVELIWRARIDDNEINVLKDFRNQAQAA